MPYPQDSPSTTSYLLDSRPRKFGVPCYILDDFYIVLPFHHIPPMFKKVHASAWLWRERCERCEAVERTDRTSSWHCGWEKAEEQLGLISIMVDLQYLDYVDYVVYGLYFV